MSDCSDCKNLTSHPPVGSVPVGQPLPSITATPACIKCYGQIGLLPILERELERLMKIKIRPIISPKRGTDPSPFINVAEIERDLIHFVAGDPNPQPSIFPPELRLKAANIFRKALTDTIARLDNEVIKPLQR